VQRFWVLSHSMRYKLGAIHELKLTRTFEPNVTGTVLNTIPLDNTTVVGAGEFLSFFLYSFLSGS